MNFNRIGEKIVQGMESIPGILSRLKEKVVEFANLVKNLNPPVPKQNDVRVHMNNQHLPSERTSYKSGMAESPRGNVIQEKRAIELSKQLNNQPSESTSFKSGIVESPRGNIVQERHSIELNKQLQAIKENSGSIFSASAIKIRGFHMEGMGEIETNMIGSKNSEKDMGNTATIEYDHERGQYKLIVNQDLFNKPRSVTFNGQELTKGSEVYFEKGQNTISIAGREIFKITV